MSLVPRLWLYAIVSYLLISFSPSAASSCSSDVPLFLHKLRSICPAWISPNPPREVEGNILDMYLSAKPRNSYTSVLFHASWCPFSDIMLHKFQKLSLIFPQIEHVTVELTSALPSVLSRHGIHSLPSILLFNHTSKAWIKGDKDLESLTFFYEKITGTEPIDVHLDQSVGPNECKSCTLNRVSFSSLEDIIKREPYLVFGTIFVLLRLMVLLSHHFKAIYGSYTLHFNVEVFTITKQLFERVFHMVDVRTMWAKVRFCKARRFHEKAKSCRVWASSLASVSLGESSSSGR